MDPNIMSAIAVAAPVIKQAVEKFIAPRLDAMLKKGAIAYKKNLIPVGVHFEEYLNRSYDRFSIISTLIARNKQKALKEVYIPLTICRQNTPEKEESYVIDSYPKKIFEKYSKVLITDTAGMGKSTLAKRIFIDIIDNGHGIPILVELRRLNTKKSIITEVLEQLNSIKNDFDGTLFLELLKDGNFIFILDGFDEISISEREAVTSDLQNFISKTNKNKFLLTSRPENALACFGDFQGFRIQPLKKQEAYALLRKYDNDGVVSKKLIEKLEAPEARPIKDFLKNPLLVSLLFVAFDFKQTLPLKKHIFYRQVYDANFETHDLTKGDSYTHEKYTKLDIDDFHRVLRYVGYICIRKQKIEFTKDEILELITEAKKFCNGLTFSESDFLKDLLNTVPIFCKDGIYYKWAHKSLQEYFAAQFIYLDSKEKQQSILLQIYNSKNIDKYANLLDLYYDIDYNEFRDVILHAFLKDYCDRYRMLQEEGKNINFPTKEDRIYALLDKELFVIDEKKAYEKGAIRNLLQHYQINYNYDIEEEIFLIRLSSKKLVMVVIPNIKFIAILSILFIKKNKLTHVTHLTNRIERKYKKVRIVIPPGLEYLAIDLKEDNILNKNEAIFNYVNNLLDSGLLGESTIKYKDAEAELKSIEEDRAAKEKDSLLEGI